MRLIYHTSSQILDMELEDGACRKSMEEGIATVEQT